jgi:hypothetical protein
MLCCPRCSHLRVTILLTTVSNVGSKTLFNPVFVNIATTWAFLRVYARMWLHNFFMYINIVYYWKNIHMHSWVFHKVTSNCTRRSRTRAILIVFEKLTRACFSQIALKTIITTITYIYIFWSSAVSLQRICITSCISLASSWLFSRSHHFNFISSQSPNE